jgi:signal transduction histidine kinase
VQELLSNVINHADAKQVTVKIIHDANRLILTLKDDGCGFDPKAALQNNASLGLRNLYNRALLIGAQLQIHSHKETGTMVSLELTV